MPRVSRRSKRRKAGYTDEHIRQLQTGMTITAVSGFGQIHKGRGDLAGMKQAWQELRHDLLPKWIAAHPGTRPYAWWMFDATERRQRSDGIVHPFDDRKRKQHVDEAAARYPQFRDEAYRLSYGRPNCLCVPDDFSAKYESELAYLDRLNLLTEEERKELR